ncbi:ABC transporter permease [Paenibacillus silagei]|uniref:ABC transporter permease n=1 Tax=Paenibacillus silagei TaxID=1670801 RepID=A0ABS4NPG3_9BACL|nr:ABC transporter permease [Paenibacillus silagei]MBP2111321.1 hypothetical protein [Paenibacillus silagei]
MSVSSGRKTIRILRAELDKLMTLPWIWTAVTVTFLVHLLLTAAFTSASLQEGAAAPGILNTGLASMSYLQAGFIILGILAACSEYTGGQIRTTLTVIPWRGRQLFMKHLALTLITIPAAFILTASGVLYAGWRLDGHAAGVEPHEVIQALLGATGYLTLTTLLSAAIGALLRRTLPALVILLGYYFIISPWSRGLLPAYFPDTAGRYMYLLPSSGELNVLTPVQGAGILMIWSVSLVAVAIVVYRIRDA